MIKSVIKFCTYRSYLRLPALLLSLLFSSAVFAQIDTSRKLREVIISNTPLPKIQTATPLQLLDAADFKRYSVFSVADVLRNFAGVNVKDYGGIGGLKTVSVRSLGANNTAVLYDGVQISDTQNGQVDLGKYTLDNVQQVTLFNGQPDHILQTARAFTSASVIIISPVLPRFTPGKSLNAQITLRTGSFGLINPSVFVQQRLSQRWAAMATVNWQKANGEYRYKNQADGSDTPAVRRNSDIHGLQTEAAIFYADSDRTSFNLRVNYYDAQRGLPGAVIAYNTNSRQRLWNQELFIQTQYKTSWRNGLSLLANGKLSRSYLRYVDPDYLNDLHLEDDRYTQREAYGSVALSYQITPGLVIAHATDLAVADLSTNQYNYAYPVRYTLLNVLSTKYELGNFTFVGNILHTNISEKVGEGIAAPTRSVYSPTLIAMVKPFDRGDLKIRGFYKSIFRNPTFNDLYYTRVGNRSLKPEYTKQFDLGFTYVKAFNQSFVDFMSFNADGYHNRVTDKIIAVPGKDLFNWSIQNLGKVDIDGLDAGVKTQAKISPKFKGTLSCNYTYQSALDVTDAASPVYQNQIPYTPKNTLAINAGILNNRFGLSYNQIWSSSRYYLGENIPSNYVQGFMVSDVSATCKGFVSKLPANLLLEVNNLFNTSYAVIRSFPMPGRSYRLSIQISI